REENVQTFSVRAGDFFGGTRNGGTWFDIAIIKDIEKGKMTYPGPMNLVHSWAYLPDLAQTFVKLAEGADRLKKYETFAFEGHAITGEQLQTALERVVGRRLTRKNMPWTMMKFIGLFSPMLREVVEMSYLWRVAHRLDEAKLENTIGTVPHTKLESALAQALSDLGKGSLLAEAAGRPILVNA
ncbi:MAG: oxidoreductase, partial [Rhizobiaceae bacterium]|nr:oxidoreductase [Rhizobiaceae bacterium]